MPSTRARAARTTAALLLLLHVGGCSRPDGASEDAADTAAPQPLVEAPASVAAPGALAGADPADCPMSGLWRRCSVVKRLESAGLGPVLLADSVSQPSLAISGAAYRVGRAELQVFLFADSAGAARQAAAVDAEDARTAQVRGILRPPLVVQSQNLVALVFDNNDRLRERVQLALAAGLPRG